jgi:hypothetical protein
MRGTNRPGRGRWLGGGLVLLMAAAAGCGSSGTVSGKVTYKGQPLGGGNVVFYAEGKASQTSPISPDGSYSISKIPAGPVKISVETESVRPHKPPPGGMSKMVPPKDAIPPGVDPGGVYGPKEATAKKYVKIPPQYADAQQSGLTYTVKSGSQTHDIDLQ